MLEAFAGVKLGFTVAVLPTARLVAEDFAASFFAALYFLAASTVKETFFVVFAEPFVAVMVTVVLPTFFAFTTPLEVTNAIFLSELLYVNLPADVLVASW